MPPGGGLLSRRQVVLTGGYDATARLWDTQIGQQLRVFTGHAAQLNTVAFSPDGKQVLTGEQMRVFTAHTSAVSSVAFSLDGQHVFTGSYDRTARAWRTDYHHAIRLACAQLRRDLKDEERKLYNITDAGPTCSQS